MSDLGLVPRIMVVGLHGLFGTRGATARGIAQIHFGFGVDGDTQRILAAIRCLVDRIKVTETCPELGRRDCVRFLDLFQRLGFLHPAQAVTQTIQNVADGFSARQAFLFPAIVRDKGVALPLAVMRVYLNLGSI